MNYDALTGLQRHMLLEYFFHYLPNGKEDGHRGHLMREMPEAYNAAMGSEVIKLVRKNEHDRLCQTVCDVVEQLTPLSEASDDLVQLTNGECDL